MSVYTVAELMFWGLPYMTPAKFSDLFTPLPSSLSQISRFCSFRLLFGDPPPSTHCGCHIWKPPLMSTKPNTHDGSPCRSGKGSLDRLLSRFQDQALPDGGERRPPPPERRRRRRELHLERQFHAAAVVKIKYLSRTLQGDSGGRVPWLG